jgi:hypothetical protein
MRQSLSMLTACAALAAAANVTAERPQAPAAVTSAPASRDGLPERRRRAVFHVRPEKVQDSRPSRLVGRVLDKTSDLTRAAGRQLACLQVGRLLVKP